MTESTTFNESWGDPDDWDTMPDELVRPLADALRALGWSVKAPGSYVEGVEITADDGRHAGLWWGNGSLCAAALDADWDEVVGEVVDIYAAAWDPQAAASETDGVLRERFGLAP